MADLPPAVPALPRTPEVLDFLRARERQHVRDSYMGVRCKKLPEDLRAYEHALWLAKPQVVVELGVDHGGSTLWFRDRLDALARYADLGGAPLVIAVDASLERSRARLEGEDGIALVEGRLDDPAVRARVGELAAGGPCLVVEDTLHAYATTRAALDGYADLVPAGGVFVVEDGIVDDPDLRPASLDEGSRGVRTAIAEWLASPAGADWVVREDLEPYGFTGHPGGWLQRRPAPPA